jgi:ATP-dependent Lon protease
MEKEHINQEPKDEELLGEAPPITVPGESEHTDEEGVNEDTAMPVHQNGQDEIQEGDVIVHSAEDDEDRLNIPDVLPVLPLKDTVIYPFAVQPLGVGQERSIRLIDDVMRGNRLVVLVAQKSAEIEQAGPGDIFKIGTVSRVARMIRMPDGTIQIIVQGLERVDIGEFTQEKPYLAAHVTIKTDTQEVDNETEAIKRNVVSYFQRLVALVQNVPEGVAAATLNLEEPV